MKKEKISNPDLEQLIKQSFLELDFESPKNEILMNIVSNSIFSVKIQLFQIINALKLFIGIGLISIVGYFVFDSFNSNQLPKTKSNLPIIFDTILVPVNSNKQLNTYELEKTNQEKIDLLPASSILDEFSESVKVRLQKIKFEKVEKSNFPNKTEQENYVFPILNQEDREETIKQKTKMLKALAKKDKDFWAYIPGKNTDTDKSKEVNPFYMQTTEVSNLEYRTFLFDLLMQDRKEEFLESKPKQSMWVEEYGEKLQPMEENYFSHPAYNNYPVNNISRKGAENYCQWLFEEYQKQDLKKKKIPISKIRIPTNLEWEHAASAGGAQFPFPWGGPYTRNAKGCFLANFKFEIASNKCEDCDTVYEDAATTVGSIMGVFTFTAPVTSYIPNDFGLYCTSGNIAEMVTYPDGIAGTKGGSWQSTSQEIQINGEDRFKRVISPSTQIGFRPVFGFLDGELNSQ